MLRRGFARHVLLSYVIRKVELADEARAEQLLPMVRSMSKHAEACRSMSKHADACRTGWRLPACAHAPPPLARLMQVATVANELSSHPEFAGGLVSTLIADPARRLTPRLARACISSCLLPLSALLPHVLLRGSKSPERARLTPSHAFARLRTPSHAFPRLRAPSHTFPRLLPRGRRTSSCSASSPRSGSRYTPCQRRSPPARSTRSLLPEVSMAGYYQACCKDRRCRSRAKRLRRPPRRAGAAAARACSRCCSTLHASGTRRGRQRRMTSSAQRRHTRSWPGSCPD